MLEKWAFAKVTISDRDGSGKIKRISMLFDKTTIRHLKTSGINYLIYKVECARKDLYRLFDPAKKGYVYTMFHYPWK